MLYDLLARYRRVIADRTAAQLCRRLLPHVPERLKAHTASFGSLPAVEQERIFALAAELKRRPEQAEDHWLRVVEVLAADPEVARFAKVGNFSSYCRCVDSLRESNGKKKGEGNTKNGNKYLAWAFIEAANFAVRYCPEAKRFYERKKRKTNAIIAFKALAHKLARACYHMLREEKPFEVKRCFV